MITPMQIDWIKEGWVVFQRIYCKEGFIDYWVGDQSDNPNYKSRGKNPQNSTISYFRLHDTNYWIPRYLFLGRFHAFITNNGDNFDADFLWNSSLDHELL